MTFPILPSNSPDTGYNLTRSLRFRGSASANLSKAFSVAATNLKIQTYSFWAKLGAPSNFGATIFGAYNGSAAGGQVFSVNLNGSFYVDIDDGAPYGLLTTQKFSDPAAWYHVVIAIDTTQTTAANRVKLYINGSQVTSFSTANYPALNYNMQFMQNAGTCRIGTYQTNASYRYDGYLAEVNVIDGQALTPSSFGSTNELTGVWQPAAYTGTYGTNGFYLPFTDNSALTTSSNVGLGKDFSGNGNYWTTNNISITAGVTYDSMTDVPTLTSATASNYCVLSPIDNTSNGFQVSLTNGNLSLDLGDGNGRATFSVSSGKWYWEITSGTTNQGMFGIVKQSVPLATAGFESPSGYYYWASNGAKYNNNVGTAYGSGLSNGDILGTAFDADAGTITFYKNGVSLGVAFSGLSGTFSPAFDQGDTTALATYNFGQRPFTYTPPTGFVALNTFNLPDSTLVKGNTVMDATLYTGNGSTQTITNAAGFQPDLVWVKARGQTFSHILTDSVRGVTKNIYSDQTAAEATDVNSLTSFNSNGFSIGSYASMNNNTYPYVGWQWKASGAASSNTSGTITSQVSVNASAGFSVSTYTGNGTSGATVGHGLGVAPQIVIVKKRNAVQDWMIGSSALTSWNNYIVLNTANAQAGSTTVWNDTAPTSSVFSLGNSTNTNGNTNTFVAYCWTSIDGYSSIGKYVGNGSASGTFVYTGFKPKFILVKSTTVAYAWFIEDIERNVYNGTSAILQANSNAAEITGTTYNIDFLSNGFKLATTQGNINGSGATFLYMAFAENPFKNSLAN